MKGKRSSLIGKGILKMLGIDKAVERIVQEHGELLTLAAQFFEKDIKIEKDENGKIKEAKVSLIRFAEYAKKKEFKLKIALPSDVELQIYEDEIPTKDGGKVKVKVLEI